ncbi:MAG: hypothetical protein NTV22_03995, partial [bacterium]|nr:hypothetical protein [bacterium]
MPSTTHLSAAARGPRAADNSPSFALRGMHLNGWAFGYPYTFRCWQETDWQRYADMLAAQGCNLFFIWPFMEIMPVPLSAADRAYLEEVHRVIDYAQRRHGMEVWIMQSANRVALNDCDVRDPRLRPYWVLKAQGDHTKTGQVDLDPAEPKQFARIMRAREALYRMLANADGFCTIDSDPGGWAQSPLGDLMQIFKASRRLLDRLSVHGTQTKLIHWLWSGWGQPGWWTRTWRRQDMHQFMCQTIRAMKRELPDPWRLIVGRQEYLPACAAERVLGKTVYLPYNTIEGEPSRPGTQLNFTLQRKSLDAAARCAGLAGLMGNVQTPLLQLPHVGFFLNAAMDYGSRKRSPRKILRALAAAVYPQHQDLLADCWMALSPAGRADAGRLARRLARLVEQDRLGQLGRLGQLLFPDQRQIARDLTWQLKTVAAFEALRQALCRRAPQPRCARCVEAFLAAALAWDGQHGWSAYWRKLGTAWTLWPVYDPAYPSVVRGLVRLLRGAKAGDK